MIEPKMSKTSEERILTALNKVASLTDANEDPNEVIAKVASEERIPSGHVKLLVNAYNTGRTTLQRQSGESVWDKSAEFALADTEAILSIMYPDKIKTAADTRNETIVSNQYSLPPSGWLERRERIRKVAQVVSFPDHVKPAPYPKDDQEPYRKASDKIEKLRKVAEEARYRASYVYEKALESKQNLADYFNSVDHRPFKEVQKNASLKWGDVAIDLFSQLEGEYPRFTKQAQTRGLAPAVGKAYDLVGECIELTYAYRQLRDSYNEKHAHYEQQKVELLKPFAKPEPIDPILKTTIPVPAIIKEALGGSMTWRAMTALPNLGSKFNPADMAKNRQSYGPDPEHENLINSMNREATLSDILSSDDVLSRRNPHEVLQAYSSLRSLAPRAMENPEVMRSLLRQRVEQGQPGGLFDLEGITKLEKNLSQNRSGKYQGGDDK